MNSSSHMLVHKLLGFGCYHLCRIQLEQTVLVWG